MGVKAGRHLDIRGIPYRLMLSLKRKNRLNDRREQKIRQVKRFGKIEINPDRKEFVDEVI